MILRQVLGDSPLLYVMTRVCYFTAPVATIFQSGSVLHIRNAYIAHAPVPLQKISENFNQTFENYRNRQLTYQCHVRHVNEI